MFWHAWEKEGKGGEGGGEKEGKEWKCTEAKVK